MKCVECQDLLTEYALDSLGPRESEQVAEHLAGGCTDCRQYLDVVRAEWSALADTLQPAPPPAHVKSELLARIRAESSRSSIRRQHVFSPEPEPVTILRDGQSQQSGWRWQSMWPYIAATLCGIALGFWSAQRHFRFQPGRPVQRPAHAGRADVRCSSNAIRRFASNRKSPWGPWLPDLG